MWIRTRRQSPRLYRAVPAAAIAREGQKRRSGDPDRGPRGARDFAGAPVAAIGLISTVVNCTLASISESCSTSSGQSAAGLALFLVKRWLVTLAVGDVS